MKKVILLCMSLLVAFAAAGCSQSSENEYADLNTTSSDNGVNAEYTIVTDKIAEIYEAGTPATTQEVVDQILEVMPVQGPLTLDDQYLAFLEFDIESIEEYSGVVSGMNLSADDLIVIRAKDGMVDEIVAQLVDRRTARTESFENYLANQYEKARCGKIIVHGNDVILAILGNVDNYDMASEGGEPMIPEGGDQPVADIPAAE